MNHRAPEAVYGSNVFGLWGAQCEDGAKPPLNGPNSSPLLSGGDIERNPGPPNRRLPNQNRSAGALASENRKQPKISQWLLRKPTRPIFNGQTPTPEADTTTSDQAGSPTPEVRHAQLNVENATPATVSLGDQGTPPTVGPRPNISLWRVAPPPPCKTVDYKVAPWLIPKALDHLQCTSVALDAFASAHNAVCDSYWTEATDAFAQPWRRWAPI